MALRTLAKDCARAIWWPSLTKSRTANASLAVEPDAKPWYAMSKKGKSCLSYENIVSQVIPF